tara:strand:- start:3216 stop:3875 length:660 start_codon:yes stop_codon:yes gene_type:complete
MILTPLIALIVLSGVYAYSMSVGGRPLLKFFSMFIMCALMFFYLWLADTINLYEYHQFISTPSKDQAAQKLKYTLMRNDLAKRHRLNPTITNSENLMVICQKLGEYDCMLDAIKWLKTHRAYPPIDASLLVEAYYHLENEKMGPMLENALANCQPDAKEYLKCMSFKARALYNSKRYQESEEVWGRMIHSAEKDDKRLKIWRQSQQAAKNAQKADIAGN